MPKGTRTQIKNYQTLSSQYVPPKNLLRNVVLAFLVGGAISIVGQMVLSYLKSRGIDEKNAINLTAAAMIFIGAFLTGLGVYDKIGRVGGMGSALPITGFANSIASPAMEFKKEGYILGLGARMFVIAGPVIVYGIVTSVAIGLFKWLLRSL